MVNIAQTYKILRITAWLLVAAAVLTLFSGFFTSKYFLSSASGYQAWRYFHTIIVPLLFIPLFYLHTLSGFMVLLARHPFLNKKSVKIAAGVLWTGILAAFFFLYTAQPSSQAGTGGFVPPVPALNSSQSLQLSDISRHNSESSCWIIYSGKVYDITAYLPYHPGGPGNVLPYCGSDAKAAFDNKPHSATASDLLASYYIGDVGGTVIANPAASQPPPGNNGKRGWEDDD